MKHLRTLSLSNYGTITKLPNSIGNLIYVRYLNLSYTRIERLPSETCNLYNLQTLLLFGCHYLSELPEDMGKLVNLRQLDISNTRLKKIPLQISRLQNLQTLSDFVVSKQCDGLKVVELGKFPHLQGKLSISALHWNGLDNTTAPPDSHIQKLVLEQLRPSTNLKKLTIDSYGGSNFPNWLGDSSFGNMVSLRLCGCAHCSLLPSLGQLQSLKELHISQMASIKSVGAEFYGSSCPSFKPFPSLETLLFWKMPEWEEWKSIGGIATQFPSLRHLSLEYCPKLKANIPSNLPSLITLKLLDCPLVVSGHPDDNSNIIKPLNGFSQLMLPLNSLHKLWIEGFPYLASFPREGLPKTLQSLALKNCEILEFLPDESLHNYTSLEDLEISNSCNTMTSFMLGSLPVLKSLYISHCKNLKSIIIAEDASQTLSFLRSITILHCDEMESFSCGAWPTPNLIHFEVRSCSKLPSLPKQMNTLTSLQELEIEDLPNLQCSAIEDLPINLRELTIGNVGGTLWNTSWCLSVLEIKGHHIVKELMKMGVPLLPTSLVTLRISHLNDIKCLDGLGLHHLTSLQNLQLSEAPNLKTLPEEELHSSLSVLSILNCPLLEASLWRKRGKEWLKIAHISSIVIDRKVIT